MKDEGSPIRYMCTYAYSPRCIAIAYMARVESSYSFQLVAFADASGKMSKDYSPRFFITLILALHSYTLPVGVA